MASSTELAKDIIVAVIENNDLLKTLTLDDYNVEIAKIIENVNSAVLRAHNTKASGVKFLKD